MTQLELLKRAIDKNVMVFDSQNSQHTISPRLIENIFLIARGPYYERRSQETNLRGKPTKIYTIENHIVDIKCIPSGVEFIPLELTDFSCVRNDLSHKNWQYFMLLASDDPEDCIMGAY